jgi:hypothetical protein
MSWAGGRGFMVAVCQGLFRDFKRSVRGTCPTSRLIRSVGVGFGHVAERGPAKLGPWESYSVNLFEKKNLYYLP